MTETPVPPPPPPPPPVVPGPPQGYPVSLEFDTPEKIARWRPLVHWLLAIPHFVVAYVLSIVAGILVIVAWFAGVFAGKIPDGILRPMVMTQRYSTRVAGYVLFLREEYPPFFFATEFADPGDYPGLRVHVAPAVEGRSRLSIFFRLLLLIPHTIVLFFLSIALWFVLVVGFFAVIILGRWPRGLGDFVVSMLRWNLRYNAYYYLLTDEFPPFGLD